MLVTSEHHREESDNGLSSRKGFLQYQRYVKKLIFLKNMKIILNIPQMLPI